MNFMQLLRSLISRLLFFGHGFISVYLLYVNTGKAVYWVFAIPLALMVVEVAITIGYGKEYKYFWPSGFLYILTIIPIIWITELDLLDLRLKRPTFNETILRDQKEIQLQQADAYYNAFKLSQEVIGKKVCELGLIIGLIAGRWLMPRGEITRDQLSALLLGYVGNAADILELFETFEEPDIIYEKSVTVGVIAVYTLSIFQFTLVTTATVNDKKMLENDLERQSKQKFKNNKVAAVRKISGSIIQNDKIIKEQYIGALKTEQNSQVPKDRGRGRKVSREMKHKSDKMFKELDEKVRRRALHGEVFQILVTLLMQDGPFLVLRLYLIVQFSITSEMHIFFTCKNAIVSILLVYRLCILTCREDNESIDWFREDAAYKLNNVQLAMISEHLQNKDVNNMFIQ